MKIPLLFVAITILFEPVLFAACFDDPNNLVPACGFESQPQLDEWIAVYGTPSLSTNVVHTGQGAALVQCQWDGGYCGVRLETDCIQVTDPNSITYGVSFMLATGAIVDWGCRATLQFQSSNDCSGILEMTDDPLIVPSAAAWTDLLTTQIPGVTVGSAKLHLSCWSTVDFSVLADDAVLGEGAVPIELVSLVVE